MKRYWVFVFAAYYPQGGMEDLAKTFNSRSAAIEYGRSAENDGEYFHVFDTATQEVIDSGPLGWRKDDSDYCINGKIDL